MLLKVISNKTMGFDKERVLEMVMSDKGKEHFLYRIGGVIEGHAIGQSAKIMRANHETGQAEPSQWVKFFGDFVAMKGPSEVYEATTCFLPAYVNANFVSMLKDDGLGIEFKYDIFAIYSKNAATSYEYLAVPVRKAGEERRATAIMADLPALPGTPAQPAIEGPKQGKK